MAKKILNKIQLLSFILSILAILLSSFIAYKFSKIGEFETREFQSNKEALIDVLDKVAKYAEVYTVDWDQLNKQVSYTNYECPGLSRFVNYEAFKTHFDPCGASDQIQKARFDFHRSTIKGRILGSDKIVAALND